jgi:hypothetical protein
MTVEERMHDLLEAAGDNVEPGTLDPARRVLMRVARRRRVAALLGIGAVTLAVAATVVTTLQPNADSASTQTVTLSNQSRSLLARPLHLPSLAPGASCPATPGTTMNTSLFSGVALGSGPVRVLLADRGHLLRGHVDLGSRQIPPSTTDAPDWSAIQTLWFSLPGYNGPFVVRGQRLAGTSSIAVQPDSTGLAPGSGPLVVPAGPTNNTSDGYRTVPGSTWVTAPGCYAWQVDGFGFSEVIVVDALNPHRG